METDMTKFSVNSLTGLAALGITLVGGALSIAVNWGISHATVQEVKDHQTAQDARADSQAKDLTDTRISAAASNQKLDDIKQQLDRIEKKL